jgi:hypothetical protein
MSEARYTLSAERRRRRRLLRPLLFHPDPVCRGHRKRREAAADCHYWEEVARVR